MKKTITSHSASRRSWLGGGLSYLALISLASTVGACGWRLRGKVNLPYKALFLTGTLTPELKDDIEMLLRVNDRAFDPVSGLEAMPESDIFLTRDIDFNQSNIQAFDQQVNEYVKNMRIDIVSQLMRRLASIKKLPTEADVLKKNSSTTPSNPAVPSPAKPSDSKK